LFSILDNSENAKQEKEAFEAQEVRSETGYGAAGASGH
jgi:cation/acetate symporter